MEIRTHRELGPEHTLELQWETNRYLFHFDATSEHLPTDVDIETIVLDLDNSVTDAAERSVIVLGGVGEDVEIMKPFLLALAKERVQVIGISLPSYGGSSDADVRWRRHTDGTEKHTFEDYGAVIDAVRKRLTQPTTGARPIQEKVDVVGHSLGGAIMAEYAATHAEHVASVHLMTPGGRAAYDRPIGLPVSPKLLLEVVAMQGKERFQQWLQRIGTKATAPDVISHMWIDNFLQHNDYMDALNGVSANATNIRAVQRFWEGGVVGQGRLDAHIKSMQNQGITPTVYAASNDSLLPPSSFDGVEEIGANLVVLDKMSHYGMLDQSERCAKIIRSNMNS